MRTKDMNSLRVPSRIASTVREIGRHIEDEADEDIPNPESVVVRILASEYVEQHKDLFEEVADHQYQYVGGRE